MVAMPFALNRVTRGVQAPIRGATNATDLEVATVVAQREGVALAGSSDRMASRFLATHPVVVPGTRVSLGSERLSSEGMQNLANTFDQEVSQIYVYGPGKHGGGGSYHLFVGGIDEVDVPIGPRNMWIGHTHPGGRSGPSLRDIEVLRKLQSPGVGSPQRQTQVWYRNGASPAPFGIDTPVIPENR